MLLKILSATALLICLGLSACTTAKDNTQPPAASSNQAGGGY